MVLVGCGWFFISFIVGVRSGNGGGLVYDGCMWYRS